MARVNVRAVIPVERVSLVAIENIVAMAIIIVPIVDKMTPKNLIYTV
jgi:hypothetical protein